MWSIVLLLCGLEFQTTLCIYICPGYFGQGLPSPYLPYNSAILPNVASSFTPLSLDTLSANRGGSFKVFSSSPVAPTGISLVSQNTMEGTVYVTGEIPFLGAVAVDGSLPAAGAGAVSYECGGTTAVLNEGCDAIAPISPAVTISAPLGAGIEIALPASIPAEIRAPLYNSYGAYPTASIAVLAPTAVPPTATVIAPVFGRFGFRKNFRGFGLGYY